MKQEKITNLYTPHGTLDIYMEEIGQIKLISPDREAELARRARRGDIKAMQRLVEVNLRFVVSVAKQYQNQGLSLPDLINEGNLGMLKAAEKFDPTRGFKFITCAVSWIRSEMVFAISENIRLVHRPYNDVILSSKIEIARLRFFQENGRDPLVDELSVILEESPKHIKKAVLSSMRDTSLTGLLDETNEKSRTFLDVFPDEYASGPEDGLMEKSIKDDIKRSLDMLLSGQERYVVKKLFGIGCEEDFIENLSEELGLPIKKIQSIKNHAILKIRRSKEAKRLLRKHLN